MLTRINKNFIFVITNVVLFFFIIFSGCSGSNTIDTISGDELKKDRDYIVKLFNITLKDGREYNNREGSLYMENLDSVKKAVRYDSYKTIKDSLGGERTAALSEIFSFEEISKAKVMYEKELSIGTMMGILGLIAVIAFLFWANGERNKRQ